MATAMHYREPFRTHGELSGRPVDASDRGQWPDFGRLPRSWAEELQESIVRRTLDYVVTSFHTPIAWHDAQTGWTVPDAVYSVTSTRHANRVREAIAYYGASFRPEPS